MVLATRSWQMPRALAMARAMCQGATCDTVLCGTSRRWSEPIIFHLVKVWLALPHSPRRFAHQPPRRRAERQQQDQRFIAMVTTALTAAWTEGSRTDEPRPLATEKIEVWLRDMVL